MKPRDRARAVQITHSLEAFNAHEYPLPGISSANCREALVGQLLESIHRVEYIGCIRNRDISPRRADPSCDIFDPLKAAILNQGSGDIDEAFWLVFIFVHFGKHRRAGWRLARDVYGALGGPPWTWDRTSRDVGAFREWLASHQLTLQGRDGVARHFGNHRKYQSIDAHSPTGTGAAFQSYVEWVGPTRSHIRLVDGALAVAGGDPRKTFDVLYRSMDAVVSFGRTAKFDYLTMLGKLQLSTIEPGSPYFNGATGPIKGARLLFGDSTGSLSRAELESRVVKLGASAGLGMQVLEDGLCNWQKSPDRFKPFRG